MSGTPKQVPVGPVAGWVRQPGDIYPKYGRPDGASPLNSRPDGSVWMTGTVEQGQVLTFHNSLTDADTLGAITYVLTHSVNGVRVEDDVSYTIPAGDVGGSYILTAHYTDGLGQAESKDSPSTINVVGVGGTPAWQLDAGHYEPTHIAAEVIFPRPDSETPAWAKHRRHPIGVPYRIPIGVSFGSWPYYFEIDSTSAGKGITVGDWLTTSGDKLIVGADYGVVEWTNPTAGSHTITITVNFQDGTTPIDITWTLEVTDTGIIYVDAVNGSDSYDGSSPTYVSGTIGPLKTLDGWYLSDYTDRTYTGYQVFYMTGTYDIYTTDTATSNIKLDFLNKPLVHQGYPGESPVWNFDTGTINSGIGAAHTSGGEYHMADFYCGGITWDGGLQTDGARRMYIGGPAYGPLPYDGTEGGQRCTWFECPQTNWVYTGDPSNNSAIVFGSNTGVANTSCRSHFLISRCDADTIQNGQTNFNGWFVGQSDHFLMENCNVDSCTFGRYYMSGKSSEYRSCYRNIDSSGSPTLQFTHDNAGSYSPLVGGGCEISYCKANDSTSGAIYVVFTSGHHTNTYDSGNTYHKPNYLFRNNFSKISDTSGRAFYAYYSWPCYDYDDIWCSESDGIRFAGPINTQINGDWQVYTIANNPFDANLNLTGTARTNYLGTHGAEIV